MEFHEEDDDIIRSSHSRMARKEVLIKNSQYSQENVCVGVFF